MRRFLALRFSRQRPLLAKLQVALLAVPALLILGGLPGLAAPSAPLAASAGTTGVSLLPIPAVRLDAMEPAVRKQVAAACRSAATAPGQPPTIAAASFGEAGRVFLLYALLDAASPCFDNAVALAPKDLQWAYFAGVTAQRRGELERARDHLAHCSMPAAAAGASRSTAAAGAAPEKTAPAEAVVPAALYRLGEVELLRGDLDAAGRAFTAALAFPGTAAAAHFGLGRVALQRGDAAAAAVHFEATLAAQPEASTVRAPLAAAYRRLQRLDQARQQAAAYGPGQVRFADPLMHELEAANAGTMRRIAAAAEALAAGRYLEAAAGFRQALAADPEAVRCWMGLGLAQERLGDTAGAERSYRRAVELAPANDRARLSLGTLLAERGARGEAIEQLTAAVRLRPDLPDARYNLARALAEDGRFAAALAQCDELLRLAPQDRDALALRQQLRARAAAGPPAPPR